MCLWNLLLEYFGQHVSLCSFVPLGSLPLWMSVFSAAPPFGSCLYWNPPCCWGEYFEKTSVCCYCACSLLLSPMSNSGSGIATYSYSGIAIYICALLYFESVVVMLYFESVVVMLYFESVTMLYSESGVICSTSRAWGWCSTLSVSVLYSKREIHFAIYSESEIFTLFDGC